MLHLLLHFYQKNKLFMKIKKILLSYYKSIIVFLLIFIASVIPGDKVQKVNWFNLNNVDKLFHLGMYFCLSFVLILDLIKSMSGFSLAKIFGYTALITVSYGGFLEIFQSVLTNSRSGDLMDLVFNIAGTILAVIIWVLIRKIKLQIPFFLL